MVPTPRTLYNSILSHERRDTNAIAMAEVKIPKDDSKSLEEIDQVDATGYDHHPLVMPAGLASLSEAEYHSLGKRATFKMDIVIMPCMVIMYVLNYLDRQNIASAKLASFVEDLGLSAVDYQTSVSILFVGYSTSSTPHPTI